MTTRKTDDTDRIEFSSAGAVSRRVAKHTPGPWVAAASPSSVVGWPVVASGIGRMICSMCYVQRTKIDPVVEGDRAFNAESKANSALIAAAPELLEALQGLLSSCPAFRSKPCGAPGSIERMQQEDHIRAEDKARYAVAKAMGLS